MSVIEFGNGLLKCIEHVQISSRFEICCGERGRGVEDQDVAESVLHIAILGLLVQQGQ